MSAASVPKGRYELFADDDDVIGLTVARSYPSGWSIVRVDPPFMDAFDEYGIASFITAQLNRAGRIGECSEREKRAAMTDAEFWAHVYPEDSHPNVTLPGWGEGDQAIDAGMFDDECPVCHQRNACGWDAEGRPLIHPTGADQ